jgi:hypothetical protein
MIRTGPVTGLITFCPIIFSQGINKVGFCQEVLSRISRLSLEFNSPEAPPYSLSIK